MNGYEMLRRLRHPRLNHSLSRETAAHLTSVERELLLRLVERLNWNIGKRKIARIIGVSEMTAADLIKGARLRRNLHVRTQLGLISHGLVKSTTHRTARMVLESIPGREDSFFRRTFTMAGLPMERVLWEASIRVSGED